MEKFEIEIREIKVEDQDFVTEMLYQAIYVKEGEKAPSRSILEEPTLKNTLLILGNKLILGILPMIKILIKMLAPFG